MKSPSRPHGFALWICLVDLPCASTLTNVSQLCAERVPSGFALRVHLAQLAHLAQCIPTVCRACAERVQSVPALICRICSSHGFALRVHLAQCIPTVCRVCLPDPPDPMDLPCGFALWICLARPPYPMYPNCVQIVCRACAERVQSVPALICRICGRVSQLLLHTSVRISVDRMCVLSLRL